MFRLYFITTKRGFTLIELLIVIVIIAILVAIGFVSYNGMRQRAYDAKVDATLNQLGKAVEAYAAKGYTIRQKYYAVQDFYANPGGGSVSEGIQIYAGGGLGTELMSKGFLNENLQDGLRGGPTRDLTLKNRIKIVTCGKNKLFLLIESYSGTSELTLRDRFVDLDCAAKTDRDWRAENGLPAPTAWGTGSGTYRVQPNYKYLELDL